MVVFIAILLLQFLKYNHYCNYIYIAHSAAGSVPRGGSGTITEKPRSPYFFLVRGLRVAWHSGRTLVFNWRTFPVQRMTCGCRVTIYVSKPSAVGQPARPTQPFILSGSINK